MPPVTIRLLAFWSTHRPPNSTYFRSAPLSRVSVVAKLCGATVDGVTRDQGPIKHLFAPSSTGYWPCPSGWTRSQRLAPLSTMSVRPSQPLPVQPIEGGRISRRPYFPQTSWELGLFEEDLSSMMGTQGLNFTANSRKLPSHAFSTRLCPRARRVNAKAETKSCDLLSSPTSDAESSLPRAR